MPVDYSKYPPNWKDQIRPDILKRDQYKCGVCAVGQRWKGYRTPSGEFVHCDQWEIDYRIRNGLHVMTIHLAVAHLDHDITNNDYLNLKAMCQRCHNRHDKHFRAFNRITKKS